LIFRHILESKLREWGFDVISVEDGNRAWDVLNQPESKAEIIVLDWLMPGLGGIELCRLIREDKKTPYRYILLISSKDKKENVIEGLEAGADDYLTKPFDLSELRARIRTGTRILSLQRKLMRAHDELRFYAEHDPLTKLPNRRAILQALDRELERGGRNQSTVGILMIDIDRFKGVNDTYGHLAGDEVLKEVASRLSGTVRGYDLVGRYGGEEFLAVLSNCSLGDLDAVAERMRAVVEQSPATLQPAPISVTISIGGVVSTNQLNSIELLATADIALYRAKHDGRNRVFVGLPQDRAADGASATAASTHK
jgi:two-component system, cell cycle response regulator